MVKFNSLMLCRLISPRIFFLGFISGILICSLIGRKISHDGYYKNYVRLGGVYQIDNNFLLSPSQIANFVRHECSTDKVLVLVGGSSIMMGYGQPLRHLWSKKLNELLGDGYCVFNLAAPTGVMNGYAATTLEILGNEYKKTFLIVDMQVHGHFAANTPDGVMSQKHYFWDAYYKNMFPPSFVQDISGKEREIQKEISELSEKDQARLKQIKSGEWLDSFFYFNELWTYVYYNLFTTYHVNHAGFFQRELRKPSRIPLDDDYEVNFDDLRKLKQYPPVNSPLVKQIVNRFRSNLDTYFIFTPDGSSVKEESISRFAEIVRNNILTGMRHNILIASTVPSPYYTDHFTKPEQDAIVNLLKRKAAILNEYGYHVVTTSFSAEDFSDGVHLNPLGGFKLAQAMADKIRSYDSKQQDPVRAGVAIGEGL